MSNKKAVALISGCLDSLLAAKVMLEHGIHVEGINFYSGFFGEGTKKVFLRDQIKSENYNSSKWICDQLKIKLHVIDIFEEFKNVFINPKHGYGSNLNPCLDCKILIVKMARKWIEDHGFDFIVSGEVLGQRPMSQRKDTLPVVARESEAYDLLVRPLSAKLLKPTKPETEGWINREQLYDFSGRTRKPQMELAAKFGFKNIPQPAGGCMLTEPNFCRRLNDLLCLKEIKNYSREEVELLKLGRHIRPEPHFKLIVGREHSENEYLERFKKTHICLYTIDVPGPFSLIVGNLNQEELHLAAEIIAGFGKGRALDNVDVVVSSPDIGEEILTVKPLSTEKFPKEWYL